MCGIVGYVGSRVALDYVIEGLRRLEYRGYDSAGVATVNPSNGLDVAKTVGRIESLAALVRERPLAGAVGIGHTRWATHGPPTQDNAHPHTSGDPAVVALAHNGVIENFEILKAALLKQGVEFRSATDTEVIVHLVAQAIAEAPPLPPQSGDTRHDEWRRYEPLVNAVEAALENLKGAYGIVLLFRDYPEILIAARVGSPLVIGVGDQEHFVASDASPLVGYTDKIVYLADNQIALISAKRLHIRQRDQGHVRHTVEELPLGEQEADLGDFPHYMLKEIHEQPSSLRNAMRGRLSREHATAVFGGLNLKPQQLRSVDRILLTACGTSWHAALYGEYVIEELSRIPVEVEYASELRYRNPPIDNNTLLFAITQSGETADTLAALREMKRKGHPTLAICNVVGSSIAQEADGGVYLHAGPEIGVASTKAYTSQCVTLAMLGLYFGRLRHLSFAAGARLMDAMEALPEQVADCLRCDAQVQQIAAKYQHVQNFLYLGRQYNFPTALEGALKLKEISYIHAEGYPAAEMKHGPLALIEPETPSVFIVPRDFVYDKVLANMEEVKARGGPIIAVCCEGDDRAARLADDVVYVPAIDETLQPIVSVLPLQLLSYHIAVLRGCDVDKPRNLAKSVTVE